MSYSLKTNRDYFFKGVFHWFGIEENPMAQRIDESMSAKSHILVKKDLQKVKKDYRKSYNDIKRELLKIG